MHLRSIVLALVMPLFPLALAAQAAVSNEVEVSGRVVDAATGEPVRAAVVELRDVRRKAVSDSTGRFVLRATPGTHQWVISRIGFADWEESAEVADGDEFTIALLARPEVLERITVVASQLVTRREASGMSVRTVDNNTLRLSASPTAADLVKVRLGLASVPCGDQDRGGPTCAYVRGQLTPVLVYIDEQRAPGGLDDLNSYLPQELYTVEAYEGGAMVRVITTHFAERLARGRASLLPLRF